MNLVDQFLNSITMYRLMLYYLMVLLLAALGLSFLKILPFTPVELIFSTALLVMVCWVTNTIFAKVLNIPTNQESFLISALILALIITPTRSLDNVSFLFWAAVLAMISKYLVTTHKKHLFNPVAFGVAIPALLISGSASWWIGTWPMLPFVLIGVLIVRKIRRFDLVLYFLVVTLTFISIYSLMRGINLMTTLQKTLADSPILFFAFVMLIEPQTTPPSKALQSIYGGLVGLLFSSPVNLAISPEIALLMGNLFSYLVSPKIKLLLTLKEKTQLAADIYDFTFSPGRKIAYLPGQYMEWTLPHSADSRGNRRYFSLASSPTEDSLRIGIRFYNPASSFKKTLMTMDKKTKIVASQLSGDFIMPKQSDKKLVFIAGGIGITPFRSMIKYLLDKRERRDIVLFYSNKTDKEIAYRDLFDRAARTLPIKIVYTLTDDIPKGWSGERGRVTPAVIKKYAPDFKKRIFYLSGPQAMVKAFEKTLAEMGVSKLQIKTDYFPGY